jgi:hypothetical protein
MKRNIFIGLVIILLIVTFGSCREVYYVTDTFQRSAYEYLNRFDRFQSRKPWQEYIKPDMVPFNVRICRINEGVYVRWDIVVTLQNQGGNLELNVTEAPIDVYVTFDPDRPYGVDNATGKPKKLGDFPELLMDRPDQQTMSVPRAGAFGGASFSLWYPDGGPGSRYRRIPTRFDIFIDQYRGGNPGVIKESNENNNGASVIIDRYDEISGHTGTFAIGCWYNSK